MTKSDSKSTLIRRGQDALSFSDMVVFADTIHTRPLEKLLDELPGIAELSETKFLLAVKVLRQRFRGESSADQDQLRAIAGKIAAGLSSSELADRIREIFDFSRG